MLQPNSYSLAPVLFLGTPRFAVPILEALAKHHSVIAVITQPDKPVGRKGALTEPPVKKCALELGLQVLQPTASAEIAKAIAKLPPFDFLITAAYGKILPESVLKLAKKDCLNVHCSLLPKYRGATPMQAALLHGDKETGVTIFRMVKELDQGPIFAQRSVTIPGDMMYPWLEKECSKLGAELLLEVLQRYDKLTPIPQNDRLATHCEKIKKEDGLVRFTDEAAEQIWNKYRAFDPWPGIFTHSNGKLLKLIDIGYCPAIDPDLPPGTVFKHTFPRIEATFGVVEKIREAETMILVKTKKASVALYNVQEEGKKTMPIEAFINGHKDFVGSVLSSRA